jgi:hypothetical protein
MRLSDTVASGLIARLPVESAAMAVRRGDTTVVGVAPTEVVVANGPGAIGRLDALGPGFWVGWCSFELGHTLERVPPRAASLEPALVPDLLFARFDALAVVAADGRVDVTGDGRGVAPLERACGERRVGDGHDGVTVPSGAWRSSLDRDAYRARVDAVLELLRAGECYQVNLTRRLTCDHASASSRKGQWRNSILPVPVPAPDSSAGSKPSLPSSVSSAPRQLRERVRLPASMPHTRPVWVASDASAPTRSARAARSPASNAWAGGSNPRPGAPALRK